MSLSSKAETAYGYEFVRVAGEVCTRLGIPLNWLLAAICWETSQFKANGPPWPVNKGDGGGGLIGFTPLKGHPAEFKGPVEQLPLVEQYYRKWMTTLKITKFQSPEDLYLIVRGPYGIGKPDSFDMGGGINKGQVLKIYRNYLAKEGVTSATSEFESALAGEQLSAYEAKSQAGQAGASATAKAGAQPALATGQAPAAPFRVRKGPAKTRGTQVRIRTGPGLKNSVVRVLMASGTRINVLDQVRGDNVNGNDIWDKIDEGYISDAYVEFEGHHR
ncbi:MAG: hypothetical protein AB1631_11895 [Acidobacteriota bacterium]